MILLPDGSVMVNGETSNGTKQNPLSAASSNWYKLTPVGGSYDQGTWTQLASMATPRRFFGSVVLPNGKVLVVGGEYYNTSRTPTDINSAELYDPVANSWKPVASVPTSDNLFGDGNLEVLPNGHVLGGWLNGSNTFIYDPSADKWNTYANSNLLNKDTDAEEDWVKLRDGSILTYQIQGTNPQTGARFVIGAPDANGNTDPNDTWVAAGNVPVRLDSAGGSTNVPELGPPILLPNGNVFWIGASGNTALYTPPSGSDTTGTWAQGPTITDNSNNTLGGFDTPAAMMFNGKVLFVAGPIDGINYSGPMTIFEYDPTVGSNGKITQVTATGPTLSGNPFESRMLNLPTGEVLFNTDSIQLYAYQPDGSANSAWDPKITDITRAGNTFTITGTQINGMSEGAAYGDDAQMASNFPIVTYVDVSGNLNVGRTSNWSSNWVQTGSTPVTTQFTLANNPAPGLYLANVAVNGLKDWVLDILTTSSADTYTLQVDPNDSNLYQVLRDGSIWSNSPIDSFDRIIVTGTNSGETVNINSTPAGVPVTVDSVATVNVGQNGSVSKIVSDVNIENPPSRTKVNVDDSSDRDFHIVTVGTFTPPGDSAWGYISHLAQGNINFKYLDTSSVTLNTGTADGNVVNVLATGVATNLVGQKTTTVNVGSGGSAQKILGNLNIENPHDFTTIDFTTINVDDSLDFSQPTVTLSTLGINSIDSERNTDPWGEISGLPGGADINYEYFDTRSLTLKTGPASTVNVWATGVATTIIGSGGTNTFQVQATSAPLTIDSNGSNDQVNVVENVTSLSALAGQVTINGNGKTKFTLDDSSVQTVYQSQPIILPDGSIVVGTIEYQPGPASYSLSGAAYSTRASETLVTIFNPVTGTSSSVENSQAAFSLTNLASVTIKDGSEVNDVHDGSLPIHTFAITSTIGIGTTTLDISSAGAQISVGDANNSLDVIGTLVLDASKSPGGVTATLDNEAVDPTISSEADTYSEKSDVGYPYFNILSQTIQYFNQGNLFHYSSGSLVSETPFSDEMELTYHSLHALKVIGGPTGNYFDVTSTPSGLTTDLYGGSGGAQFILGAGFENLLNLVGTVNVHGQGGTNTLAFFDESRPYIDFYILTSTNFEDGSSRQLNYDGIQKLEVDPTNFSNQLSIQGTAAGTSVTINAGSFDEQIKVGDAGHNLSGIGSVTVNGQVNTLLEVDDSGTYVSPDSANIYLPLKTQFTVDQGTAVGQGVLTRTTTAILIPVIGGVPSLQPPYDTSITYSGLTSLTIDGGPATQGFPTTYQVLNTSGTAAVAITANTQGNDAVTVADVNNTIGEILAPITVTGNANTMLTVNDSGTTTSNNWDIGASSIDRYPVGSSPPAVPQVTFHNLATVSVTTGTAKTFINIQGTSAGATTIIKGNNSFDQFVVRDTANLLDDIKGPLVLHGSGVDFLSAVDGGNTVGQIYTITAGKLQRSSLAGTPDMANITYDGMGGFILSTANSDFGHTPSIVNVPSLNIAFNVLAIAKGDIVTVGQNGSMAGILGELRIQGILGQTPSQITLDDSADMTPHNTTTTAITLSGNDPTFGYLIGGLLPNGGRIGFLSLDPTTPVSILGGPTVNFIHVYDFSGSPAISITGNANGTNTLQGPDTANNWQVTGVNAGRLDGKLNFTGVQSLTGGAANDTFAFLTGAGQSGRVDGGGGVNTLDYSAYQGDITVNLRMTSANNVDGAATGGIANIQNTNGSIGNDILVGDANPNVLKGGTGRNLIIGGDGADTVIGGSGENIVIGGHTLWDTTPAALQAILHEFLQTYDPANAVNDFNIRINNIKKGKGTLTNTGIHLQGSKGPLTQTVFDDGVKNTLSDGGGLTWFWLDALDIYNSTNGNDRKDTI
jgi:hypothetical protein